MASKMKSSGFAISGQEGFLIHINMVCYRKKKIHLGMGNSEYQIRRNQIQNASSNQIIGFGLYSAYKLYHVAWSQIFFMKKHQLHAMIQKLTRPHRQT